MSERLGACNDVHDDLGAIVDGRAAAVRRHADHLASCDDCRDLRHAAAAAAEAIADAGADFVVPHDLEDRLRFALSTRKETPTPTPAEGPRPVAEKAPIRPVPAPSAVARPWLRIAAFGALASAAAVVLVTLALGPTGLAWWGAGTGGGLASLPTTATVTRLVRAAPDGATGLVVRAATGSSFVTATAGAQLPAGAIVRTDARTRVELTLSDGSTVVLDHETELALDAGTARALHLAHGEIVAEVAHVPDAPPLTVGTPTGTVEVLGTRLALSASESLASVRVARGTVRVHGAEGPAALVFAGQEAVVPKSGAVRVAAVAGLARELGWARLGEDVETEGGEAGLAGLGELCARRPGDRAAAERPLRLVRHDVRVRIAGNVARTEIEEVFRSDDSRELEGIYRFPLPPGASIARLALDVDGRLEEGAFVERERAGRIWRGVLAHATAKRPDPKDDIVWVPGPWRDPALLEWKRGGRVELRIFPIPARGERRVVVAYTETLPPRGSERRWVYPLPHASDGSTRADRFSLDVRIAGADAQTVVRPRGFVASPVTEPGAVRLAFAQDAFVPAGDLAVSFVPRDSGAEMRAFTFAGAPAANPRRLPARGADPDVVRSEQALAGDARPFVTLAIRPEIPAWTEARPKDHVIVVDSSQSMVGERYARAARLASSIVAGMDRLDRFAVLACDLTCQTFDPMPRAPSAEGAREVSDWLGRIRPAGASNLSSALAIAASALEGKRDAARDVHVLYLGDGVASVGNRTAGALASRARSLARSAHVSFTTVGVGADADMTALAAIARAGGGHHLAWRPGERASDAALAVLETTSGPTLTGARIELPAGLTDVAPSELPNLRAGEEVLVTGRMSGEVRGEVVVRGEVGGRPWFDRYPIALSARADAGNAFVPALWAAATIEKLEQDGRGEDRARIVALSKSFGVLSRHTSLLVLESEAMMRAFGLERTESVASWTGEEEAVANESTGLETHAPGMNLQAPAKSSSSLGLVGQGRGGGSVGDGTIGLRSRAPSARSADEASEAAPERFDRDNSPRSRPVPARRGPGRFMRRVWFRTGGVQTVAGPSSTDLRAVAVAEAGLRSEPDSRARHRDLFKALARAGDPARAQEIAEKWLGRDPLDAEALARLADAVARQGRRSESLRILSGIVEADPDAKPLHDRLARAFERVGSAVLACAHRVALSEISPSDLSAAADAVRCTSTIGDREGAGLVYAALSDDAARRRAADAAARTPDAERTWGEVVLDASWVGAGDLDIALVAPDGTRLSWMGGRSGLSAEAAAAAGRERLALRRASVGTYLVEVTRTDPADRSPASGRITVAALGARRTLDFTLQAERAIVGRVVVRREFRLEPVR